MPAPTVALSTRPRLAVATGAAIVVVVLGAVARRIAVSPTELDVFRWFNGWPDALARPLWLVMQLGGFWIGLGVGVVVLGLRRGWRGAVVALVTVPSAWLLAIIAKTWFGRGRPADYLATVSTHGEGLPSGNGYPSAHTTVAFALAVLVAATLPRRWRPVPYALAVVVAVARLYVGAHLPLDVVGGAALGIVIGTLGRFLLPDGARAG